MKKLVSKLVDGKRVKVEVELTKEEIKALTPTKEQKAKQAQREKMRLREKAYIAEGWITPFDLMDAFIKDPDGVKAKREKIKSEIK